MLNHAKLIFISKHCVVVILCYICYFYQNWPTYALSYIYTYNVFVYAPNIMKQISVSTSLAYTNIMVTRIQRFRGKAYRVWGEPDIGWRQCELGSTVYETNSPHWFLQGKFINGTIINGTLMWQNFPKCSLLSKSSD